MKAALPFSWSMLNIFCFTFASRAMRFCFSAGVSCLLASAKAAAAAASFLAFSRAASFARFFAAAAAFFSGGSAALLAGRSCCLRDSPFSISTSMPLLAAPAPCVDAAVVAICDERYDDN